MADSTLPAVPADSKDLICTARARSNAAIAAHDLAGVAREWMDDVHVVSAAGLHATGPAARSVILARQFGTRPDTKYVRTPRAVEVFAPWAVASERGDWVATRTEPDGPLELGGSRPPRFDETNAPARPCVLVLIMRIDLIASARTDGLSEGGLQKG